jgi:hypothetical protein
MIRKGRGAYTESSPERRVGKKFKTNADDFKKIRESGTWKYDI